MERERIPLLCALIAIVLLGVRLRELAITVAMAGIAALVWDEAFYVPLRFRGVRKCGGNRRPRFNPPVPIIAEPQEQSSEPDDVDMASTDGMEVEGYTDTAEAQVTVNPIPVVDWDNEEEALQGLVVDEYSGGPAYARFQRSPNFQELTRTRLGTARGGRDRLARIWPRIHHSGYRDTTGQMCRFGHLR